MARIILIKSGSSGRIFKDNFEMEGHEVVALATNQFEAVAALRNPTIEADVVVTGLSLYRFPGDATAVMAYELADYYQQRGLPVVILSAYHSRPDDWPKEMQNEITVVEDPSRAILLKAIEEATA